MIFLSRQCISGSNHDTLVYSMLCTCKSLLSLLTTLKITKQMLSHLHLDYISETLRTCHFVYNQSFSYSALFICRSKNYEAVLKVTSNENGMKTSVSINKQHRQIINAENRNIFYEGKTESIQVNVNAKLILQNPSNYKGKKGYLRNLMRVFRTAKVMDFLQILETLYLDCHYLDCHYCAILTSGTFKRKT